MADNPVSAEVPDFEKELESLERSVDLLERGNLGLEEAILQYESGCRSLKKCYQVLENARKRIEILTGTFDAADSSEGDEERAGAGCESRPEWRPLKWPENSAGEPGATGGPETSS
jgi:exodeoxyribonuclease VII small subunit